MADKVTAEQIQLLQQILAHDSGVLSIPELEARNPDMDPDSLQQQLDRLIELGLLTIEYVSEQVGTRPSAFYAVTESGINLLKDRNLYDEISIWNQVYSQVPTPDGLIEIEHMERPEPGWYENTT